MGDSKPILEGIAWTDSIDIFSDRYTGNVSYDSKNVNVDSVQQEQKDQVFTYVNMFNTKRQDKNIGTSREMKCKKDNGVGANLISLNDYKKANPSEFDEPENSFAGYSHD